MPATKAVATRIANAAAKAVTKEAEKVGKRGGLLKVMPVSPALKKFLGVSEANRTETMKKLWIYVKDHHLQDPDSRRDIVCDEKLKTVLGKDRVKFTEIPGLLSPHFPKNEDKKV